MRKFRSVRCCYDFSYCCGELVCHSLNLSVFVASTVDAVSFAAVEYSISTQGGVGGKLLLLREGRIGLQWRDERRTINTQGGVGGGCISKCF